MWGVGLCHPLRTTLTRACVGLSLLPQLPPGDRKHRAELTLPAGVNVTSTLLGCQTSFPAGCVLPKQMTAVVYNGTGAFTVVDASSGAIVGTGFNSQSPSGGPVISRITFVLVDIRVGAECQSVSMGRDQVQLSCRVTDEGESPSNPWLLIAFYQVSANTAPNSLEAPQPAEQDSAEQ